MQAQLVHTANLHSVVVWQHYASTQQVALQQERTDQRNRGKGGAMGLPATLGAPKWTQLGAADDIYADTQHCKLSGKVTSRICAIGIQPQKGTSKSAISGHQNYSRYLKVVVLVF